MTTTAITPTLGTKQKTTKTGEHRPPTEIRENTKARRAWLQAKVEELAALPGKSGKIVGQGSYQVVSEYTTVTVAGRLRHQGVCQFCGNQQVVKDGVLVLHGYQRPGWGSIFGRCPGAGHQPLQRERIRTEGWLAQYTERCASALEALTAAIAAAAAAKAAQRAAGQGGEWDRPRAPSGRWAGSQATQEQLDAYQVKLNTWRASYPLTAVAVETALAEHDARTAHAAEKGMVEHFRQLLTSGTYGKPLVEQVVA